MVAPPFVQEKKNTTRVHPIANFSFVSFNPKYGVLAFSFLASLSGFRFETEANARELTGVIDFSPETSTTSRPGRAFSGHFFYLLVLTGQSFQRLSNRRKKRIYDACTIQDSHDIHRGHSGVKKLWFCVPIVPLWQTVKCAYALKGEILIQFWISYCHRTVRMSVTLLYIYVYDIVIPKCLLFLPKKWSFHSCPTKVVLILSWV